MFINCWTSHGSQIGLTEGTERARRLHRWATQDERGAYAEASAVHQKLWKPQSLKQSRFNMLKAAVQGLALGFVLLRFESLVEEGKI
jgi:hypothetical protein